MPSFAARGRRHAGWGQILQSYRRISNIPEPERPIMKVTMLTASAILLAIGSFAALPAQAHRIVVYDEPNWDYVPTVADVDTPPPPPQAEVRPPSPGETVSWIPGHWKFKDGRWEWKPGHYIERPGPDALWVPGHWVQRGWGWTWVPGYWM
jgi:hypothetical protein